MQGEDPLWATEEEARAERDRIYGYETHYYCTDCKAITQVDEWVINFGWCNACWDKNIPSCKKCGRGPLEAFMESKGYCHECWVRLDY